jgi:hypothetical protein
MKSDEAADGYGVDDNDQEGSHPDALDQVLEGAWPILSGVAQSVLCQRSLAVVEALCDVYQVRRNYLVTQSSSCLLKCNHLPYKVSKHYSKQEWVGCQSLNSADLCELPALQRSILSAKLAARPLIATLIASCLTIFKVCFVTVLTVLNHVDIYMSTDHILHVIVEEGLFEAMCLSDRQRKA